MKIHENVAEEAEEHTIKKRDYIMSLDLSRASEGFLCRRPFVRCFPQPTTTSFSTFGLGAAGSLWFAQKDPECVHFPSLSKPLSCVVEAGSCVLRLVSPSFSVGQFRPREDALRLYGRPRGTTWESEHGDGDLST